MSDTEKTYAEVLALGDGDIKLGIKRFISNYQHVDCERRIAELTAQVESLQNRWASRPLSNADLRERLDTASEMLRTMTKLTKVTPNVISAIEEFLSVPTP